MPILCHLPVLATSQDAFRKPFSFSRNPLKRTTKDGGAETLDMRQVCTKVLSEQEPARLLPALTSTRAHSQPGHSCPPPGALGGSRCLQCSAGPWVPALGTSLRSHGWKPEVGGMGAGLPRQNKRDPRPCPESAKALLFMFRLDHPLRILLKGGFHGWKRFEKSQLYLNSVSAKAK